MFSFLYMVSVHNESSSDVWCMMGILNKLEVALPFKMIFFKEYSNMKSVVWNNNTHIHSLAHGFNTNIDKNYRCLLLSLIDKVILHLKCFQYLYFYHKFADSRLTLLENIIKHMAGRIDTEIIREDSALF